METVNFTIQWNLLLPEIFISSLALILLCIGLILPRLRNELSLYLALATLVITLGLLFVTDNGALFMDMYVVDPLARFFKIIVLGAAILVVLLSRDYLKKGRLMEGEFYALILFSTLGMMLMSSANNFLNLYIGIELTTFSLYVLVTYLRGDRKSNEAGLKFFILGIFTSAILLYGISLVYFVTGDITFTNIINVSPNASPAFTFGMFLILVGLAFKIGAVPFHVWVPDVYEGAPTPITAFISVAPKAAGIALLLRILLLSFASMKNDWVIPIMIISAASMTYGNIVAISQTNMKRLLAYSGIAQIGNVLMGLAAGTKLGGSSMLFYLLVYLFANIGAFAVVIIFANITNSEEIADLSGLSRRSPLLGLAILISLLSLAGVPPLGGFMGKFYVFTAAIREGLILLVCIGLVNAIISLYYYLVIIKRVYIGEPMINTPIVVSNPFKVVIYASIAGVIILGIYPGPFIDLALDATKIFIGLLS